MKIPVRIHDNALGTPLGQQNLPGVHRDAVVSTDAVMKGTPVAKVEPVVGKAKSVAGNVPGVQRITAKAADAFHGNKVTPHVVVPVEFAGNAIAAGGDAAVSATSSETDTNSSPVLTSGSDGVLGGNVVNLDWALPVRISGNAIAALGKATTYFVSENTTVSGGDIVTDGANSVLAGNVASGQFATPVGVTANAVSAAGIATAVTAMDDEAHAPGTITTNGDNTVVGGTGAGVPIALPVGVHGNAASAGGKSWVAEKNTVAATAGQALGNRAKAGNFITTSGKESVLSGTVAEPAIAGTVDVTCNAATLLGTGDCDGATGTVTQSGGSTSTNGDKSTGGGTALTPSAASPVQLFANSATLGGLTDVHHVNTDTSKAGGNTVTSGKDAVLAGTIADPALAGPVEAFGNAASVLGIAKTDSLNATVTKAGGHALSNADNSVVSGTVGSAAVAMPAEVFGLAANVGGQTEALVGEHKVSTAGGDSVVHADNSVLGGSAVRPSAAGPVQVLSNSATVLGRGNTDVCNDVVTKAGGVTGTTGNDSSVGGNAVTPAVGLPAEVLGNNANLAGLTSSKVDENKVTAAGGLTNTHDDAGVLASNAVVTSLAGPVQVFGNSATGGGIAKATAIKDTMVTAGGPVIAKGTGGAASGNVAAVPLALPGQAFGLAAGVVGKPTSWATGDTSSTSGGTVTTDGKAGTINGNVASLPGAGAIQVFGDALGIGSVANGSADNDTDATAGGNVLTNGQDGSIAGNVASVQPLAVGQAFGDAAALTGLSNGSGHNDTVVTNGGDITTSGDRGSIAGNLADVPVAAIAQVFGDAAAVGGNALGAGPNETTTVNGGEDTTSGNGGNLSGNLATVPAAGAAQIFGNAASAVGNATGVGKNHTTALIGGDATTDGEYGSISGNLFAVPVTAAGQVFGNAGSVGGHAVGAAENTTTTLVGGDYETDGPMNTLSGVNQSIPLDATQQIFAIPVPVLAHAVAQGKNIPQAKLDDTAPIIDLPIARGGLAANKLPRLPRHDLFSPAKTRADGPVSELPLEKVPVDEVLGLPGRLTGAQMNVAPNLGTANVNGMELSYLQEIVDAAQTQPMSKVVDALPMHPSVSVTRTRSSLPVGHPVLSNKDSSKLPTAGLDDAYVNGVGLSGLKNITGAADLSSLDEMQALPVAKVVKQLPVQPDFDRLPKLP
ncbi:beta strand repeat-containing protein [Actinosynnema sp. ALI-1.44]|uniref:beta strand repeat-containing protein n=1 Tax=Actinosynnema sp. ALI-1.44 TaxID=1933779 RepID=UPI0011777ACE|nr:hypothetical protein [Actinosynnema sp. ALI-1.44]